jgi:hypothetical protein
MRPALGFLVSFSCTVYPGRNETLLNVHISIELKKGPAKAGPGTAKTIHMIELID